MTEQSAARLDHPPGALNLAYAQARHRLGSVLHFARSRPLGAAGGFLVLAIVLTAILAPFVAPYDPNAFDYDLLLAPPSWAHPFGNDNFGRDVFSRVVWGARTSLYVAIAAVSLGQCLGFLLGTVSAYIGGKTDLLMQRLNDLMLVFPSLFLALVVVAALGHSVYAAIFAIAIAQAPESARTQRAAALAVKGMPYIESARAVGCSDWRIIYKHIFPNTLSPLLVVMTAAFGSAILTEASLSFLGLGVPPPNPSWGAMLSGDGRRFMQEAPWMVVFPGLAITFAVLGFNLLGDALRDTLDPRLRRRWDARSSRRRAPKKVRVF
jgi:peptide/nickel transport system permease protein